MAGTKICKKCQREKPLDEFYAHRAQCKECVRERVSHYAAEHREYYRENTRRWKEAHPEEVKSKRRERYWRQRDSAIADTYAWKKAHPDRVRASHLRHPESARRRNNAYRQTPKGRACTARIKHRRRSPTADSLATLTAIEWAGILTRQEHRCACCGVKFDEKIQPTRDHIVPVSLGGDLTLENVQALCRSCNIRKSNKIIRYQPPASWSACPSAMNAGKSEYPSDVCQARR